MPTFKTFLETVPDTDGIQETVPDTDGFQEPVPDTDGFLEIVPDTDGIQGLGHTGSAGKSQDPPVSSSPGPPGHAGTGGKSQDSPVPKDLGASKFVILAAFPGSGSHNKGFRSQAALTSPSFLAVVGRVPVGRLS